MESISTPPGPDKAGLMNRFFATRRAINKGDPLFDYTDSELRKGGFMTPVSFNVMESVIAAMPGLVIMLILILGVQPQILKSSGIEIDMIELYRQLAFVCCLLGIYVFLPPIYTGVVAPFAGAGSIRIEDRTPDLKKGLPGPTFFMMVPTGWQLSPVLDFPMSSQPGSA